jgi:uncharacterized DUF497 family protein
MKITFDPAKRDRTLQERSVDFRDAETVFGGLTHSIENRRFRILNAALLRSVGKSACGGGGRRLPKIIGT